MTLVQSLWSFKAEISQVTVSENSCFFIAHIHTYTHKPFGSRVSSTCNG